MEAGRPAAGYAVRGFGSALFVSRARRDEARVARFREVIEDIAANFGPDTPARAFALGDPVELLAQLRRPDGLLSIATPERTRTVLAMCNDDMQLLERDVLDAGLAFGRGLNSPLVEAEIHRAIGLAETNRPELKAALDVFERSEAHPFSARVKCELALMDGNRGDLDAALAYLESIGDVVQVERYLKRWATRR
jgi:hypothetical protein